MEDVQKLLTEDEEPVSRRTFLRGGIDNRGIANNKVRGAYLSALMIASVFSGTVAFSRSMTEKVELNFDYDGDFPLENVRMESFPYEEEKTDVGESVEFDIPGEGKYGLTVEDQGRKWEMELEVSDYDQPVNIELGY